VLPQSERANIIKDFLKWLEAKTKLGGASYRECIRHIQVEITDMGAEEKRCNKYIKSLLDTGLVHTDRLKYKLTDSGKNWLQRKVP